MRPVSCVRSSLLLTPKKSSHLRGVAHATFEAVEWRGVASIVSLRVYAFCCVDFGRLVYVCMCVCMVYECLCMCLYVLIGVCVLFYLGCLLVKKILAAGFLVVLTHSPDTCYCFLLCYYRFDCSNGVVV